MWNSFDDFLEDLQGKRAERTPSPESESAFVQDLLEKGEKGLFHGAGDFSYHTLFALARQRGYMKDAFLLSYWADFYSKYTIICPSDIPDVFASMSNSQVYEMLKNLESYSKDRYIEVSFNRNTVFKRMAKFIEDNSGLLPSIPIVMESFYTNLNRYGTDRVADLAKPTIEKVENVFITNFLLTGDISLIQEIVARMEYTNSKALLIPKVVNKIPGSDYYKIDLFFKGFAFFKKQDKTEDVLNAYREFCIESIGFLLSMNQHIATSHGSRFLEHFTEAGLGTEDVLSAIKKYTLLTKF